MADITRQESQDAAAVNANRGAATCLWATPTLFIPAPFWFEAENAPWTCMRDEAPQVLGTTERCAACLRWEPRPGTALFEWTRNGLSGEPS